MSRPPALRRPPPQRQTAGHLQVRRPPPQRQTAGHLQVTRPPPQRQTAGHLQVRRPPPQRQTAGHLQVRRPPPQRQTAGHLQVTRPPPQRQTRVRFPLSPRISVQVVILDTSTLLLQWLPFYLCPGRHTGHFNIATAVATLSLSRSSYWTLQHCYCSGYPFISVQIVVLDTSTLLLQWLPFYLCPGRHTGHFNIATAVATLSLSRSSYWTLQHCYSSGCPARRLAF